MDDDKKHSDQFDAALPLPTDDTKKNASEASGKPADASVSLIRKKIERAYASEPSVTLESHDIEELGNKITRSKHQQFIYELTSSGKPLHEIQEAWHEYYAGLPEAEKHEVWSEFYSTHKEAVHAPTPDSLKKLATPASEQKKQLGQAEERALKLLSRPVTAPAKSIKKIRQRAQRPAAAHRTSSLHSLLFGLGIGGMVLVIFLFSFFNERFIAPFIQPSRVATGTPIIASAASISSAPEIIIPKINVEIPVVYDVNTIDENAVENALERGVVHYADTALPGQDGNLVIVGHSSNNIFNPGKYKFAFVLLSRLSSGDTFYLQKDGKRYTYQVYKKAIVDPNDISVLGPEGKPATATLITCDPPGTSLHRLVVVGEQIDPNPANNTAAQTNNSLAQSTQTLPGNSPSLWSRFVKWLSD